MHAVTKAISLFLTQHQIRGGTLLLGVSGGADSMALLRGLLERASDFECRLLAVHVDHGLRLASADDAAWVARQCDLLNVPCHVARVDLAPVDGEQQVSEAAARQARYGVFRQIAREQQAGWLATAHTADDQAETVLHHLLRGSSWRGLRGIPEQRPLDAGTMVVRPLLQVTRVEVEAYLASIGQEFRIDESNLSPRYTRNRLRSVILPLLCNEYGPQVPETLRRLALRSGELADYLRGEALQLIEQALIDRTSESVRLNLDLLAGQPALIIREACVMLWEQQGWPRQSMSSSHWELLAEIMLGETKRRETLPGNIDVLRNRRTVLFSRRA